MMVLPQLILLIGWFSLNKFYLGHWVGHYGSATHLQLRPAAMFGTEMKYFVKYLGFARYTDHYKELTIRAVRPTGRPADFGTCADCVNWLLGLVVQKIIRSVAVVGFWPAGFFRCFTPRFQPVLLLAAMVGE